MPAHILTQIIKTHLRHPFNRLYYGILIITLLYTTYIEHEISKLETRLGRKPSFGSFGTSNELNEILPDEKTLQLKNLKEKVYQSINDVELTFPKSKVRKLKQSGEKCYKQGDRRPRRVRGGAETRAARGRPLA